MTSQEELTMNTMPKRDTTGKCEGECRDRVYKGEQERQAEIDSTTTESLEASPSVPWANIRNAPPGSMGGHV